MKQGTKLKAKKKYDAPHNDFFINKKDLVEVVRIEQNKIHLDYFKEEFKLKHLLVPEIHNLYVKEDELNKYFEIVD